MIASACIAIGLGEPDLVVFLEWREVKVAVRAGLKGENRRPPERASCTQQVLRGRGSLQHIRGDLRGVHQELAHK